ncbi:PQQ-binding-like beta-propeller repeat protein [Halobacillus sp. Nhm2S1]|uniref:outer membrane protein assembly factor BamB family protein n=1 Tax=Halobacillus sp. Nhm2S1 TaxID=2866716 RepID=UPI001C73772E|nr:PQQ-binding-like beta-propeller repeat protein [Halobacillus sp. Nhm2S1]MBX0357681.1 hypothetical protein [Halobacillus sp. Nhm2S1]
MKYTRTCITFMLCSLLLLFVSESVLAKEGKVGSSFIKGNQSMELSTLEEGEFLNMLSGNVNPDHPVSREEYIKVLVKSSHIPLSLEKESSFKDLMYSYSLPYINTAVKKKFLIPEEFNFKFQPQKPITKIESAIMIARLLDIDSPTEELPFKDEKKFKEHRSLVKAAFDAGYVEVHSNGKFLPNKPLTYRELNAQVGKLKEDLKNEMDEAIADVTYLDTVKKVPDIFLYNLIQITPKGDIQLRNDQDLENYQEGDILIIPPLDNFMEGLSLKVSSVEEKEDYLIIKTKDPSFNEIFSEVGLDFTKAVTPEDIVIEEGIEMEAIPISEEEQTLSVQSISSEEQLSITGYRYLFKFDKSLMEYEDDNELASLRLEGEFSMEGPTLTVKSVYENFLLKEGSVSLSANQKSNLNLRGDIATDYENRIKLAKIKFPVKNAFSAEVVLSMRITASGKGYLEVGMEENAEINTGVKITGHVTNAGLIKYEKNVQKPRGTLNAEIKPVKYSFTGTATAGPTLDFNVKYNQLNMISSENAVGVIGKVDKNENEALCLSTGKYITSDIVWKFITYEKFPIWDLSTEWNEPICSNADESEQPEDPLKPELIWTKQHIGVPYKVQIGPDGNLYYAQSGGRILSLNPDGEVRWERSYAIPRDYLITREGEFFISNISGVMAYDLNNNPLWSTPLTFGSGKVKGGLAIMENLLIVAVSSSYQDNKGASVYAVTKEGRVVWEANLLSEGAYVSISNIEVSNGHVYIVADGSLFKINSQGEVEVLLKNHYLRGKPVIGDDGTVYVLSSVRSRLYAVSPNPKNLDKEGVLWSVSTDYLFSNGSEPRISPNGKIYINGADKITVVNPISQQIEASYGVEYRTYPVTFDDVGNTYVVSNNSMTGISSIVVFDEEHNRLSSYIGNGVSEKLGGPLTLGGDGVVYSPGRHLFALRFHNIN